MAAAKMVLSRATVMVRPAGWTVTVSVMVIWRRKD
jgi:hypothetical protein